MSSFKDKLKLAMESAKTIAKNAIEGNDLTVPNEVYLERLSICNGCEKHVKATNQCGECGCFLSVKGKLAGMKCPLNKWKK
jgi:tRNA(Ile2) C34 agmatinyltransferase TiaS